jgi:putative sigma-54 modulation protein
MELQIQSVHFDADVKLLEFIEKRIAKLETFFDRIVTVDVILRVEATDSTDNKFVEIKVSVPGTILIAKETAKSFEEATDEVADSLRRQLIKHKEKSRV